MKKLAESALSAISAELDGLYARTGRPSIPPERLLKAQLLIAFYSVRSDRLFCEQLDYNLLFRWCPYRFKTDQVYRLNFGQGR